MFLFPITIWSLENSFLSVWERARCYCRPEFIVNAFGTSNIAFIRSVLDFLRSSDTHYLQYDYFVAYANSSTTTRRFIARTNPTTLSLDIAAMFSQSSYAFSITVSSTFYSQSRTDDALVWGIAELNNRFTESTGCCFLVPKTVSANHGRHRYRQHAWHSRTCLASRTIRGYEHRFLYHHRFTSITSSHQLPFVRITLYIVAL